MVADIPIAFPVAPTAPWPTFFEPSDSFPFGPLATEPVVLPVNWLTPANMVFFALLMTYSSCGGLLKDNRSDGRTHPNRVRLAELTFSRKDSTRPAA